MRLSDLLLEGISRAWVFAWASDSKSYAFLYMGCSVLRAGLRGDSLQPIQRYLCAILQQSTVHSFVPASHSVESIFQLKLVAVLKVAPKA